MSIVKTKRNETTSLSHFTYKFQAKVFIITVYMMHSNFINKTKAVHKFDLYKTCKTDKLDNKAIYFNNFFFFLNNHVIDQTCT